MNLSKVLLKRIFGRCIITVKEHERYEVALNFQRLNLTFTTLKEKIRQAKIDLKILNVKIIKRRAEDRISCKIREKDKTDYKLKCKRLKKELDKELDVTKVLKEVICRDESKFRQMNELKWKSKDFIRHSCMHETIFNTCRWWRAMEKEKLPLYCTRDTICVAATEWSAKSCNGYKN